MFNKNNSCHCKGHAFCLLCVHIVLLAGISYAFVCACNGKLRRAASKIKSGTEDCIDTCRETLENIIDE